MPHDEVYEWCSSSSSPPPPLPLSHAHKCVDCPLIAQMNLTNGLTGCLTDSEYLPNMSKGANWRGAQCLDHYKSITMSTSSPLPKTATVAVNQKMILMCAEYARVCTFVLIRRRHDDDVPVPNVTLITFVTHICETFKTVDLFCERSFVFSLSTAINSSSTSLFQFDAKQLEIKKEVTI